MGENTATLTRMQDLLGKVTLLKNQRFTIQIGEEYLALLANNQLVKGFTSFSEVTQYLVKTLGDATHARAIK